MKKNILIILLSLITLSTYAQDTHFENKNSLKISVFEFGRAEFQCTYEHYFGNRSSSISIMPSIILTENREEYTKGFQIMGQYRIYLSHLRSDEQHVFLGMHNIGFYTGAYGLIRDQKEDYSFGYWDNSKNEYVNDIYSKTVLAYEGGVIIGIQIDITSRIVLDYYMGGGVRYTDNTDTFEDPGDDIYIDSYGVFDQEYQGVKPRFGLQVGIVF